MNANITDTNTDADASNNKVKWVIIAIQHYSTKLKSQA